MMDTLATVGACLFSMWLGHWFAVRQYSREINRLSCAIDNVLICLDQESDSAYEMMLTLHQRIAHLEGVKAVQEILKFREN
jgi:hypothetical protein